MSEQTCLPRVLACRPEHQNKAWCDALAKSGFTPIALPLLAIYPVCEGAGKRAIQTQILDIDAYSPVIFVSQNAVSFFFDWLDQFWPELPAAWVLVGIGAATRDLLQEKVEAFGGASSVRVEGGENAMNSHDVLGLPLLRDVAHKKILICRGQGGKPLIGETLSSRGAQVSYCELYQRVLPEQAADSLATTHFFKRDALVFFSGETVQNFVAAYEQKSVIKRDVSPYDLRVVVPGERVYTLAQSLGFNCVYQSANATQSSMLATLKKAYQAK